MYYVLLEKRTTQQTDDVVIAFNMVNVVLTYNMELNHAQKVLRKAHNLTKLSGLLSSPQRVTFRNSKRLRVRFVWQTKIKK